MVTGITLWLSLYKKNICALQKPSQSSFNQSSAEPTLICMKAILDWLFLNPQCVHESFRHSVVCQIYNKVALRSQSSAQ